MKRQEKRSKQGGVLCFPQPRVVRITTIRNTTLLNERYSPLEVKQCCQIIKVLWSTQSETHVVIASRLWQQNRWGRQMVGKVNGHRTSWFEVA